MMADYNAFRVTILDLIALRRERFDALPLPDPALLAELEDLETEYLALVDTTTDADKAEMGEF